MDKRVVIKPAGYPALFREAYWSWGPIRATFELFTSPPDKIANINVVPFVGDQCVVIRTSERYEDIPGGTLEPGERYLDTARRELQEEAGAELVGAFNLFGGWNCFSEAPQAYRPHLPHPEFYRVVGYGEVKLTGKPMLLDGAEIIVSVEFMTISEAGRRFQASRRDDLAEVYHLANTIRTQRR